MADIEKMKKELLGRKKKKQTKKPNYISTGSTMLNLAITDDPNKGFMEGKYYFIVGDSISGKTFLALTCFAEAAINPAFNNHRFIYDNGEDGALMNIEKFFGKDVKDRLEPPVKGKNEPVHSDFLEEFYFNVDDALKDGRPFIYILDSMDSLTSLAETNKFDEQKNAHRKGKEVTGSYGDGKAKINSANIRQINSRLKKTPSILIVINQTRDNIGFGFEKKTRSGGHALHFYSTVEIWSSIKKRIKKIVRGKKRQLGILSKVDVRKNRITGKERAVEIPIYHSFGVDDIGSCIDYLVDEKEWKKKGAKIHAEDFDTTATKKKLIKYIEKNGLEDQLKQIVAKTWHKIEEECSVDRKPKYK